MSLEAVKGIFAFVTGACIGSFLNVVIARLPLDKNIAVPRSHCPQCKSLIRWHQNLPLLSFAWLKGRCAVCKTRISWRYPIVELLTALLFTAAVYREPAWQAWPFLAYFLAALVASTCIDLEHWIIPDKITLPGIAIGFLGSFLVPGWSVLQSLSGILFGGGIFILVGWAYLRFAKREGIGGGDVKFLAMVGAFLGFRGALVTLILSSFAGAIIGVAMMTTRGKSAQTAIPFGPFLAAGALASFLVGDALWQWYFQRAL